MSALGEGPHAVGIDTARMAPDADRTGAAGSHGLLEAAA